MILTNNISTDQQATFTICDLLREKGPTAVKCRFKTQLNAFCRKMLCNIFTSAS